MMPTAAGMRFLYVLIFLSGVSGLLYQVVWHKYLAILLGAQARATAVVLAIFLGGISVGYATFGKWSRYKSWNLLTAYSLVEVGLGIWAFFFPFLFRLVMPLTSWLYGVLGVGSLFIDILMSIVLIGLPTFLMGGTLPLLTQGLSRDLDEASETHAKIYGWNTVGACLGCVFAGYVLIPSTALWITSVVGGCLNIFVGVFAYFFYARRMLPQKAGQAPAWWWKTLRFTPEQVAILVVGYFSGFYLITLETVLIRLMGLSTGSSNYNFTLIVAIFIFGLGIGSLLVRRISKFGVARLYWNQVLVSGLLLLLYLSGDYWSYWVHVIRVLLRDLTQSFYLFQFLLAIGFLALLSLPIGFSGLTLPLCFHLMKDSKEGLGERVGQLYGLNTVGCVMGAMVGGYFLLNFVDLDHLFKICVFLSIITVGASLFLYVRRGASALSLGASSALIAVTLVGLLFSGRWTRERFIQPFRQAQPIENVSFSGVGAFSRYLARNTEFLYWKDGPNTSVGIGSSKYQGKEVSRTIFVNGKSDGNTRGDYFTTVMLGHIPAVLAKRLEKTCVIGLGTGITIGVVAAYDEAKKVDVVEISNFSIENAWYFDPYNGGVSKNSKVKFHEMDAFRFLQGTRERYDIIISEPSNPWVTGIENLYSTEFYDIALSKMTEDGVFVQWIHTYSFSDELLRMVLKTMASRFGYVSVFQLKGGDLALIAKRTPISREDVIRGAQRIKAQPQVQQMLASAGISRIEALLGLEIIPHPVARVMGEGVSIHSLESPKLSNGAARAFFAGQTSKVQLLRRHFKEFYSSLDSSLLAQYLEGAAPSPELLVGLRQVFCDNPMSKTAFLCEEVLAMNRLADRNFQSEGKYDDVVNGRDLASLDVFHRQIPTKFTAGDLQAAYTMFEIYKRFGSPIARVPIETFLKPVEYCLKTTVYSDELYGECLLQKVLVLETIRPATGDFQASVLHYLDWFPNLSKTSPNFAKLDEARSILARLAATFRK